MGDIHLEPGQVAALAESATQPGWDLQILNADGTVAGELQLKATDSLSKEKSKYEELKVWVPAIRRGKSSNKKQKYIIK